MVDEKFFTDVMTLFPDFEAFHEEHKEDWGQAPTTNSCISDFSSFIKARIRTENTNHFPELFLLVENSLKDEKSSKELTNALCVSFLENLVNAFAENEVALKTFVPLLGEESKDYIRGWDEFTGVKTPGV